VSHIRAIAVDIDGTLLDSQGRASRRSLNALRRCSEAGIVIYVATARPRRFVFGENEIDEEAPFLNNGGVFSNGAMAVDDALGLYAQWAIPGLVVSQVVDLIIDHGEGTQIALQFEDRDRCYRVATNAAALPDWGVSSHELVPLAEAREWDCPKVLAFGDASAIKNTYEQIVARFPDELSTFLSDGGEWVQVTSHEARKELALKHLLQARGISPEETIVFGDDTPDIGMLRAFKHSVAMGNACDAVKAAASHVTATNDEDGIALALSDHFGLIGQAQ